MSRLGAAGTAAQLVGNIPLLPIEVSRENYAWRSSYQIGLSKLHLGFITPRVRLVKQNLISMRKQNAR